METLFLTAGISDTSEGFEAGELKKPLDQKFGSTSTQAFFDELDKLSLSVLDQSKLIYYIARFKETVQLNPDFGDGESLVKRFIAGIKIPRLADRVSSEAKTAGKKDDLTFVMKQALTEIDDMIAIRDEVKAHPESFGIRSGPELGKRRSLHSKDGHQNKRSPIRCFNCGKIGHKAAECWSKPKPDTKSHVKATVDPSSSSKRPY
ncbi:hypothetical protein ADUPG1_003046, partial [Aduncisulcus paluster]